MKKFFGFVVVALLSLLLVQNTGASDRNENIDHFWQSAMIENLVKSPNATRGVRKAAVQAFLGMADWINIPKYLDAFDFLSDVVGVLSNSKKSLAATTSKEIRVQINRAIVDVSVMMMETWDRTPKEKKK